MAAVEVTISGMLYDKLNRTSQNVVLIGEATLTGLGIGGGPIIPEPTPPRPPLGIWPGPGDPDYPSNRPPGSGRPPDPPPVIMVPAPPPAPPPDPSQVVPPSPAALGWAWVPDYGWGYFPAFAAGPKR